MSLTSYKKKRSFDKTSEPEGGTGSIKALRFVIQKHDASHLHYDFRLEMNGVLKSWAVPKGPSTDPDVKRLAIMVEDHPYDYREFEGVIPKGEYGGGTVIVWDEGTYEPIADLDGIKLQEKHLLKQLKAGSLKVVLHGKKLKGEFALVKTNWKEKNSWLLIKHNDKYASTDDVLLKDKSVKSNKTIAQIEHVTEVRKPFYQTLKPCLATLVDHPIDNDEWLYEIKWDGYRAISFMNEDHKLLKSRNNKSFNEQFFPVYNAIKDWECNAIVDGEIVVVNDKGISNFAALQNWKSEADGGLLYYVFDIVWYDGHDLKDLPLTERRSILSKIIPENSLVRLSKEFDTSGKEFLEAATRMGLEGIMAKRKDSVYETNRRTSNWLKIKSNNRQEVVIGGYTTNSDTNKPFSSLLVGVFEKDKFVYTGKIGTGFTIQAQKDMIKLFEPLIISRQPFHILPDVNKSSKFRPNPPHAEVTWLKPKLICEVSFAEMTNSGVMRHPTFKGLREDKKAKEVVLERKEIVDEVVGDTQIKKVNGHELKFTNLNKFYWPVERITKRDLINYYHQVSPYILPYLKNRPQSLNRHPDGITGTGFYQKDVTGKVPDWMDTYLYHSSDSDQDKHFLLGNNEATLLYMVGLGCIEMNPWNSTIKKPDYPTWCIIDLDPDKNSFNQVIEAALVTKDILDGMGVPSYCKTSGSTGLHIYIPLGAKYTYEQSKEFAKVIVTLVHRELPKYTSLERAVKDRKGKMYLDFLQNRASATVAAPYSVRPKPGATVSMPLAWDEVKKGLKMKDFTIFNALERIESVGDLFLPVLGKGIDLRKIVQSLK